MSAGGRLGRRLAANSRQHARSTRAARPAASHGPMCGSAIRASTRSARRRRPGSATSVTETAPTGTSPRSSAKPLRYRAIRVSRLAWYGASSARSSGWSAIDERVRHLDALRPDQPLALHRAGRGLRQLDRLEALAKQRARAAFDRPLEPALELTEQTSHRRTAVPRMSRVRACHAPGSICRFIITRSAAGV